MSKNRSPFHFRNEQNSSTAKKYLLVFFFDQQVGVLTPAPQKQLIFRYTKKWLRNPRVVPLSFSFPLQEASFDSKVSTAFFINLLPESIILRMLTRKFNIDEQDTYALLSVIGEECAGAISVVPEHSNLNQYAEYKSLTYNELNQLLIDLHKNPMLAREHNLRLSLSGVQNKLPIFYNGEQFFLAKGHAPTSHIIKPGIQHLKGSVINEVFCMQLAGKCGLKVPKTYIIRDLKTPIFLVERYDRYVTKGKYLLRLHQEDFCQALGIPPKNKYEGAGGADLSLCFGLVERVSNQAEKDKLALLNWVIFNYLIGNADAHAKNLSLLYRSNGIFLAPFYDLLSTAIYPRLTKKFSMRIGKRRLPLFLRQKDWKKLLQNINMEFSVFQKLSAQLIKDISRTTLNLSEQLVRTKQEKKIIDKIRKVITKRSRKLQGMI